jgi:enoyl-CoA hydratase/carnithine racemase
VTGLTLADGIGTVTIDNAPARNALDNDTRKALLDALRAATADAACVAIVLNGAGDTFCAGGDLASMPTDEAAIRPRLGEMHEITRLLHSGPKPVVAAVDGFAFGSGLSLASASDRVVATDRARFGCSFGRVGIVADSGLLWTLPHRVGGPAARAIMLENRVLEADEAQRLGLVDEVVPATELRSRAEAWAGMFRDTAPGAVAATKRLLAESRGSLDELLTAEMDAQIDLLATADFAEGRAAFFEKRPAVFDPARARGI